MKNVIFSGVILLCTISGVAQRIQGNTLSELKRFIGEWKWNGGNQEFTIVLRAVPANLLYKSLDIPGYAIVGGHKFIRNGQMVESTLEFQKDSLDDATTLKGNVKGQDTLVLLFNDLTMNRSFSAELVIVPGNDHRAMWTSRIHEQLLVGGKYGVKRMYPTIQTIPENIQLWKAYESVDR